MEILLVEEAQEVQEPIPEREDSGEFIEKEMETYSQDEEVLGIMLEDVLYPATAFEEIVHKLLK